MSKTLRVIVTKVTEHTIVMTTTDDERDEEMLLDEVIEGIEDGYGQEESVLWRIEKVEAI